MNDRYIFDKNALNVIFDEYAPLIHKYAGRFCLDSNEVDSIFGNVFVQYLGKLSLRKRPPSDPRITLYRRAYDTITKEFRDSGQKPPSFIKSLPSQEEEQNIIAATRAVLNKEISRKDLTGLHKNLPD